MKALAKTGPGMEGMELIEVPEPSLCEGEIKVRVSAAGICGTDIHIMRDEYPYNPPVILGHEYVGIISEVGSAVDNFKVGERVVSLTAVSTCGRCVYCRDGLYMLCPKRKSIGSGLDGAMAEYVKVPARLAYSIPDSISYGDELAMCEPLACCIRAVSEQSRISAGDVVLISGPGTIGLLTLQLCTMQGARVIVSGTPRDSERLELAKELGAERVVDSADELLDVISTVCPGGVDAAFECAGVAVSADNCLKALKKRGGFTQVALYEQPIMFDFNAFLFKELTLYTTFASEPTSWDRLMSILKTEKIKLKPLFSNELSLEDWQEGFRRATSLIGFKTALRP